MQKLLFVALGGAIGSSLRYLITFGLPILNGSYLIWRTFSVNIIGSLLIGISAAFFESNIESPNLRVFLVVGILGGFTTFSSFAVDNIVLIKDGDFKMAAIYILSTNVLGILAAFLGYYFYNSVVNN